MGGGGAKAADGAKDEESVGTTLLRECCKHYHATELRFSEGKLHGWGSRRFKQNKRLRTKKNGTGSNALSGLRAPELAAEFKRLRTKYLGDATMPEPPALAHVGVTLEDLALTIHPHPTLSEQLAELSHLALGMPVHAPLPKR